VKKYSQVSMMVPDQGEFAENTLISVNLQRQPTSTKLHHRPPNAILDVKLV